jgi:hypothetical protein
MLGIRYLWIDSLCILQSGKGSVEGWLLHSSAMRMVYSNCIMNISASRAKDANEGLFAYRNPRLIQPCRLAWHGFTEGFRVYTIVNTDHRNLRQYKMPLAKRGWVLQERLLSPRSLSFAAKQVFWDCCELRDASETYSLGAPCKLRFRLHDISLLMNH